MYYYKSIMKISILGYGSFGEAIASRLILRGHSIIKEKVEEDSDIILVSVPSHAVKEVLLSHKNKILGKKIIICSKGLDESGSLFSDILNKELPNNLIYFLYGPTIAEELKNNEFSVMLLSGAEGKEELKRQLESDNFKIIISEDYIGLQVASALKNIVGILIGIIEGSGCGQNTQGYVFSKGLQEIQKVGVYLGADPNTFIGIASAGDLFVKSRNRLVGIQIGKGLKINDILKDISYPTEGLTSLSSLIKLENKLGLDLTFFKIINDIIYNQLSVSDGLKKISDI